MKLLYKCAICGVEYGLNGMTNHIQRTHKMNYKDYYDTYIGNGEHPACPICGKECGFTNHTGYRDTCGNPTCVRKLQHMHMVEKYGKECCRPEKSRRIVKPSIEYKYHCELCGQGFMRQNKLNGHLKKFHGQLSTEEYYNKYFGVKVEYCEICGQRALWKGIRYHNTCGSPECTAELRRRHNAMHNPEYRQKVAACLQRFTPEEKQAMAMKREATMLKRYGVKHNWQSAESRKKCIETTREKYGTANGFQMPKTKKTLLNKYGVEHFSHSIEFAKRRKKKYMQDGIGFDSLDEINLYNFARICGKSAILHPDIRFTYIAREKEHWYEPDFSIDGVLYEVKGKQFFKNKDVNQCMVNPYDHSLDDIYEAKHQCMLANNVHIVSDTTLFGLIKEFYGVSITEDDIMTKCFGTPFPGADKWPANHPIWDCYVPSHSSPRVAWTNEHIFRNAVRNLITVTTNSIAQYKYHSFCRRHIAALREMYNDAVPLSRLILNRFTVAKFAPKVTALKSTDLLKIIESANIDLSAGVYCPMAGFGGIVEGAKRWFSERKLEPIIEAYDINPYFCEWYGWQQRDVMAQVITTDKVVVVCPPFGKQYEHWKGTPDEMSDISFLDWVKNIKEHVKAPNYIFIGPETSKPKVTCGLFAKKLGIALYKEEE